MNACYCYLVVEAAVQNAAGIVETNENYKVDIPAVEAEEKKVEPTALEKFWKAVRDNPSDFTGWTYLLQYVEQQVRPYTSDRTQTAIIAHYAVSNAKHLTVDHV